MSQILDLVAFIAPELTKCTGPGDPNPPIVLSPFAQPDGQLWLGYVDGDIVHPDRLTRPNSSTPLGTHTCDESGFCTFDSAVKSLTPEISHSPCAF